MNKMITTNVRMKAEDMMMAKEMASDMGLSFNGYINWLVRDLSIKRILAVKTDLKKSNLKGFATDKVIDDKPMGLNTDDELIYG